MSCNVNANKAPCPCPTKKTVKSSVCGPRRHFGVERNFSPVDCDCFVTKNGEDVNIAGKLTTEGDVDVDGTIYVAKELDVDGDIHACGDVVVKGDATFCGMVYASEITTPLPNPNACCECPTRAPRRVLKSKRVAERKSRAQVKRSQKSRAFHLPPGFEDGCDTSDSSGSSSEDGQSQKIRLLKQSYVCGDFGVGDDLLVKDCAEIRGSLKVGMDLNVCGTTHLEGDVKVDGETELCGDLVAKENVKVTKDLNLCGKLLLNGVEVDLEKLLCLLAKTCCSDDCECDDCCDDCDCGCDDCGCGCGCDC